MSEIGYIESIMNSMVFQPPDRSNLKKNNKYPDYIETFKSTNSDKADKDNIDISYFIIHPKNKTSSKSSDHPYILWNHGNACDLISCYPVMRNLYLKLGEQIGIIMYDYEGYGLSSGNCRECNCYYDLEIMINFCIYGLDIQKNRLFLIGQSLGSGVVIDYVSRFSWENPIILLSPYKTISRVMYDPHHTNIFTNFFVKSIDRFCSIDKIGKIDTPIIIYHGMKDKLISYKHSVKLCEENKKNTLLILLKNANHNDILSNIDVKELWNIIFNHINSDK